MLLADHELAVLFCSAMSDARTDRLKPEKALVEEAILDAFFIENTIQEVDERRARNLCLVFLANTAGFAWFCCCVGFVGIVTISMLSRRTD